ncbi:serine/threonine-protein kinase [Marinobacter zhanjiangensis]|uniref:Serine/threonine protein kinase n=1 Tax=Marinobacter zhanjiangensis TaxID=578215 RepID=A0ABQ3B2E4_9GAMM|nr:serine/threonine-protein kinase [Marinobacter zhanjiangensis]GGY71939.1 serine/threonine protein kinase [Marinobacter zhanjiangensis]
MDANDTVLDDSTQTRKPGLQSPAARGQEVPEGPRHKRLGMLLNGRYRIVSLIASGGMSDVYKAVDQNLEKAGSRDCMVALKILRTSLTRDPGARSLLAREAAKSKRLSHPNIIRIHDLNHDGDTWFLVMELLEGEPLSRIIQRAKPNGLKWKGCVAVLRQVADALEHSHSQGIVHADLKPSNIFFTREGRIKLLDFGVSRALQAQQPEDYLNPRSEDETSIYGYTPAYASPELIEGKDPSPQDDLYALACISYELLSSRHPFDRQKLTLEELGTYKLKKPDSMPRRFWGVVKRNLRYDPRYSSLELIKRRMIPLRWQPWAASAVVVVAAAGGSLLWYQQYARAMAAEQALTAKEQHQAEVRRVMELPPEQLLTEVNALPSLERSGILRQQSDQLLDWYLTQIEGILVGGRSGQELPDIPAALDLLAEAGTVYPRDHQLAELESRIIRRRQSLEAALGNELATQLQEGNYRSQQAWEDVTGLTRDLELIGAGDFTPSEEAVQQFDQQLSEALDSDNDAALARLLILGEQLFADRPGVSDKLARAATMETSIRELGKYYAAIANGDDEAVFPARAAEDFYADRFERWRDEIANAGSRDQLDSVYEEMIAVLNRLPSNFEPLSDIRQQLSDAYLAMADSMLARNRTRQAQPLLSRARELMR